jgi:hypothetical protein
MRMPTGLAGFLLLSMTFGVAASPSSLEVGQRWQYKHEGPRPGSMEPNVIDGERIVWVKGQGSGIGGQGSASWVIEERFTGNPQVIGRLYVDEAGLLTALEIVNEKGEKARLRYDPPVAYQPPDMNLQAGEAKTIETTLRMDSPSFAIPNKTRIERLGDETVSTQAGEFTGCQHFRITTQSTMDVKIAKIPMTEDREQWFHPSAKGMVKEVYHKGPVKFLTWSRPGYTSTSTLMAVGNEKPDPSEAELAQTQIQQSGPQGPPSPPPPPRHMRVGAILLAGAVTLVAALLWAGHAQHSRSKGR